jgi:serine/threonine-protein kinase PknG
LKREEGFCPKCGQGYSFKATLSPGDVVAAKYEIKGTVAFGGLGWIYLALDTVLNRWVILKGLLNSKDPHMLEVAVQEREYLAAVKHPNIVGIYDFVTHGTEGFIVMEYVNGKTLMSLRKGHGRPLPPAEAISYLLEILPAFQYLSDNGLVYCDFKPENVMVEEETVKLIDMGAVRREDDSGGDIYGSKGYTAPEARDTPTAVSDLFSVARALAVMVASFDFQGEFEYELPGKADHEAFARHESLYAFLLKATRKNPDERFQSASEMADQLLGVLRDVLGNSSDIGTVESALFDRDSDREVESGDQRSSGGLPHVRVDRDDPAADIILAAGAVSEPARRKAMFERALKTQPQSLELKLRLVDELVRVGDFAEAEKRLAEVQRQSPGDWRYAWYRGRALLAQGRTQETLSTFQSIVDELPGELAPKQALGRACEASGLIDRAIHYYDAVSRADATFTSAALALARCLEKKNDKAGAAEAYRRVPGTSSRYAGAQMALARALVTIAPAPTWKDVIDAGEALTSIDSAVDGIAVHELRAIVFTAGVALAETLNPDRPPSLMGFPAQSKLLRAAAESELRTCARYAKDAPTRWAYVDRANAVRPLTWT